MAAATTTIPAGRLDRFERELEGELLRPATSAYEQARRVWNGVIDRRPALIVRCVCERDVSIALRFARAGNLSVSVRGGGHNVAGTAVQDGALMLDMSRMREVDVDPEHATLRAQAGATWGELDAAGAAHGMATPGARISTVGIAGSTLGGGYGWLMRMRGLTIDNLLAVDVVLANGHRARVSADEHPELFWGLRGGGTLAVATAFHFALQPIEKVLCGVLYYPAARARDVLQWYRWRMATAPDELNVLFNLVVAPHAPFVPAEHRGAHVAALTIAHFGPEEQARRDLVSLHQLGQPLLATLKPRRYTTLQRLFDAAGVAGRFVHTRAGHVRALDDRLIEVLAPARASSPLSTVMLAPLGGAVARVLPAATAFSQRDACFDLAIDAVCTKSDAFSCHAGWADRLWAAVGPCTSGVYMNELDSDEQGRLGHAYGSVTTQRLVKLARVYDPDRLLSWRLPV